MAAARSARSNTSPEIIGDGRMRFEIEIATILEPFAKIPLEQIDARVSIFGRVS
jgi:hypothetical protein